VKLYNVKTKQIQSKDIIETSKGLLYVSFLNDDELVLYGYKRVIEDAYPLDIGEMNEAVRIIKETDKTYHIGYEVHRKSLEDLETAFKIFVQDILDTKAKEHGYDSIVSACSYAGYDNDFRAEGEKFGVWRAHIWQWGYALLADIKAGRKQIPTSLEEALEGMPKFND
jgi:hypothetical protein